MKYYVLEKDNREDIESGTSYRAMIKATYAELKNRLGYETCDENIDDKVHTEWVILFENGMVGTIYDWYNSDKYNEWHIGGHCDDVVDLIYGIFYKSPPQDCMRINYKELVGYTNRPDRRYTGKLMEMFT